MSAQPRVVVIGGGNAGLCAAIAARRCGVDVTLIEGASCEWRGGNSKYTRNVRCVQGPTEFGEGYSEEEFLDDLISVTGPEIDTDLAEWTIARSRDVPDWMESNGIRWQLALNGTLSLSRTNRFFLGGGKALVNVYTETANALGVDIRYQHRVSGLLFDGARCVGVTGDDGRAVATGDAYVIASGGFEANLDWLSNEVGEGVRNCAVRGSRQNDGSMLRALLDHGAASTGNSGGFHAIAVDSRGPDFEGGIITRVDSVPLGIMVNAEAQRFADEGADLWPKRYASWGKLILGQPGQRAYSIFDAKSAGQFMTTMYPPYRAHTIQALASELGLDSAALGHTVDEFNAAVRPGAFDAQILDDCTTVGLDPPKSHWAQRLDTPPFFGYPLRPGITFTFMGVQVGRDAVVVREDGTSFENVFAAGEVMAGNILKRGYLAGFGMTIGTVFGRIAGEGAATHVRA